jgi:hypothetical protein
MMIEPRNPFNMRTSEHITSDVSFLRLFGPGVLDLLPKDHLWNKVQIFRSAPGGGKTTLFRVFTPQSLQSLYDVHLTDQYKDLYAKLNELEVFSEDGPQVLGVMHSCARNYAALEDLSYSQNRKENLLYSLLDARLVLVALRGALTLKKLNYPDDLDRLSFLPPQNIDLPIQIPLPGTGRDLYDWARAVEKKVFETLESFGPSSSEIIEGHDTLYALSFLKPECILCDGKQVASRVLIMLDDMHKLAITQRQKLSQTLFDLRPSIGVWLAERLEALSPNEIIGLGSTVGREYEQINLEVFWNTNSKRFESSMISIAEKRARLARDYSSASFVESLQDTLDGIEWQERFETVVKVISERVKKSGYSTKKYEDWIGAKETLEGTPRQRAIAWKALEILIKSDIGKPHQLNLFDFDEFSLPEDDLNKKEDSRVRNAAELYIAQEFNFPYYFGISRLATLSSANIDQFLYLAGDLFEEIISSVLIKKSHTTLTPARQEAILKKAARQIWDNIPNRVPYGKEVQKLLKAIQLFTRAEWDQGTASYGGGGGITGIALNELDLYKLTNPESFINNPDYERLSLILSACISHNLLKAFPNRKQGPKDKKNTFTIFYLNRALCMHFGLPLQHGGWKPKSPRELVKWIDYGIVPPNIQGGRK